jgi:amino acid transporter
MKNKEIELVNLQMASNIIFIGTIIVSFILLYNRKLSLSKDQPFLNARQKYIINLLNQLIVLALTFVFLYIIYERYNDNTNPKEKELDLLNLYSSILIVIGAIITTFVAFNSASEEEDIILQTPFA